MKTFIALAASILAYSSTAQAQTICGVKINLAGTANPGLSVSEVVRGVREMEGRAKVCKHEGNTWVIITYDGRYFEALEF